MACGSIVYSAIIPSVPQAGPEISPPKNVRDVKIVNEGIYPYVEREYELID